MFEIIFIIVFSSYILLTVFVLAGVKRKHPQLPESALPAVTVIVAARDEEHTILRCLQALDNCEYPVEKLQILIAHDNSSDNTAAVIDTFIASKPKFTKIEVDTVHGHLRGKSNALTHALQFATGEVIATTDADCAVSPLWIKTLASYYTGGVGIVNGFTYQECNSNFEGMQSLDFLYLLFVSAGTINNGLPISCIGNNMSYLRKAYNETGGYRNMPFSVTEDSQLLLAIAKLRRYRSIYPLDKNALAASLANPDIQSVYKQKKRWAIGGLSVPWYSYIIMAIAWLTQALLIPAMLWGSAVVTMFLLLKIVSDFVALLSITRNLGVTKLMRYFPVFQLYYFLYVVVLPFTLLFNRKVVWKGRTF